MRKMGGWLLSFVLGVTLILVGRSSAKADGLMATQSGGSTKYQCTLNGSLLSTCTVNVPTSCIPICGSLTSGLLSGVSAGLPVAGVLTVVGTSLATSNVVCVCP